jgi:hypothetical protein
MAEKDVKKNDSTKSWQFSNDGFETLESQSPLQPNQHYPTQAIVRITEDQSGTTQANQGNAKRKT